MFYDYVNVLSYCQLYEKTDRIYYYQCQRKLY